jgi:hypothetical protein
MDKAIDKLLAVIQDVAGGVYSTEIMDLTGPDVSEPVRTIAEAMGMMMVKVEAREYRLELMVEELQCLNEKIRRNTIKEITKHPGTGAKILMELDFLGEAREYVHCHHERIDGKGYPRRLPAEYIPLGARIIAVADSYDAMTTDRPYQKGMAPAEALAVLRKQSGVKLDKDCVEAFAGVLEEDGLVTGREKRKAEDAPVNLGTLQTFMTAPGFRHTRT